MATLEIGEYGDVMMRDTPYLVAGAGRSGNRARLV
jgi:hypothetical protein